VQRAKKGRIEMSSSTGQQQHSEFAAGNWQWTRARSNRKRLKRDRLSGSRTDPSRGTRLSTKDQSQWLFSAFAWCQSLPLSLSSEVVRRTTLKKSALIGYLCIVFLACGSAAAQQFDVAFGVSGVKSAPAADALFSTDNAPQSVGGGTFIGFSGDFLFLKQFGVGGEVNWRAKQNLYQAFGAAQPFRPIFYDFNAVWAPKIGKHAEAEFQGGIGSESARFYQAFFQCSTFSGCTNFVSSNHFLTHVGGGLRLFLTHRIFIRPEAHYYFVRNNFEFSSNNVFRAGASIGYSLSPEY
jgi:hypothetical protein